MILCVNPNASIDRAVVVENFRLDAINRPQEVLPLPGGKGCNVARALKTLGETPVVTGWAGGHNGRFIEDGLRAEGIRPAFVRIPAESRMCVSIADPLAGTLTEIYEPGPAVSRAAQAALERRVRNLLPEAQLVTLSGSVPPGPPAGLYADLIRAAHAAGVPAILDAKGEPLRLGLAVRPRLVKPNQREMSDLLGRQLISRAAQAQAAREVAADNGLLVVLSLVADGAIASDGDQVWMARPPAVHAVMAVGSGDAMLAGLAVGLLHNFPLPETLRLGVAAGTANTLCIGTGRFRLEDFTDIAARTAIEQLRDT